MKTLRMLIGWSLVAFLGYGMFLVLGHYLSFELNSALLLAFAAFSGLCNTAYWQIVNKLNTPPIKDASQEFAREIIRRYERRRESVFAKWVTTFIFAALTGIGGALLRVQAVQKHFEAILFWSYFTLSFALVLGILILVEYSVLSRLARDLPMEREEQKRKTDLLLRLQVVEPKPKQRNKPRRPASC